MESFSMNIIGLFSPPKYEEKNVYSEADRAGRVLLTLFHKRNLYTPGEKCICYNNNNNNNTKGKKKNNDVPKFAPPPPSPPLLLHRYTAL